MVSTAVALAKPALLTVMVAFPAATIVAVNVALVAPPAMVTLVGTVAFVLLLARFTLMLPAGAA